MQHVLAHYDACLRYYDLSLQRILLALGETGPRERTVVVVTSNHGEDLYEHGTIDHGLLFDKVPHVPLAIHDPEAPQRGLELESLLRQFAARQREWAQGARHLGVDDHAREVLQKRGYRDLLQGREGE